MTRLFEAKRLAHLLTAKENSSGNLSHGPRPRVEVGEARRLHVEELSQLVVSPASEEKWLKNDNTFLWYLDS